MRMDLQDTAAIVSVLKPRCTAAKKIGLYQELFTYICTPRRQEMLREYAVRRFDRVRTTQ
jgi:hypothetical protein